MEGCKDLDGLASCGIIRVEHLFHLEIDQRQLIGLVFYRASHPDESSLENENGRCLGKTPRTTPVFAWKEYSVIELVYTTSRVGFR